MKDYVISATAAGGTVRAYAAVTTDMVSKAKELHDLAPVCSAALGRTLTGAALISKTLKNENDTLTIQVKGNGPIGGIVTVADSKGNVRGYVNNPHVYLPLNSSGKLDVGTAVGREGYLNVIKDLGLKEPYIGYVNLLSGEIAEDIAYYYATSEQIPTVVNLGVLVGPDNSILNAGGYILQLMPGAGEDIIGYLEEKIKTVPPITTLLSEGKDLVEILDLILLELTYKINDESECRFQCNCFRERMERNVISLGKKEIQDIIKEQESAELHCHFCNSKYNFSKEELQKIIKTL